MECKRNSSIRKNLKEVISLISTNPELFPLHENLMLRKALIDKNNYIVYRVIQKNTM